MASKEEEEDFMSPRDQQDYRPVEQQEEKAEGQSVASPGDVSEGTGTSNHVGLLKNEEKTSHGKDASGMEGRFPSQPGHVLFPASQCWDDFFLTSIEKAINTHPGKWMSQLIPGLKNEGEAFEDKEVPELFEETGVSSPKASDQTLLDTEQSPLCWRLNRSSLWKTHL
ncbi:hypothetical protein E2320_014380 [Naja naja]|nr:hypothetical protein E2320_014380 [Naja naja]